MQSRSRFHRLLGLALAAAALQAAASALAQIGNPGLEAPYAPLGAQPAGIEASGEIAHGWSARAGGPAKFSRESSPGAVREGGSAQRIDLLKFTGKQTELTRRFSLTKGESYRITVWLRASDFFNVQLSVREAGPPYKVSWTRKVGLSTEWEAHEFSGVATADDAFLVVAMHAAGTVWIDGVKVAPMSAPPDNAAPPPAQAATAQPRAATAPATNLLPNSSFEAGVGGGWAVLIRASSEFQLATRLEYSAADYSDDARYSAHGKLSLRVPLDRGLIGIVTSPLVPVSARREHTASIRIRADAPAEVRVALHGTDGKEALKAATRTVGPEWQLVSVTAPAPVDGMLRLRISCVAQEPVELWLDAAQLEAGAVATDYVAPFPAELSLTVPRPGGIVFDAESTPVEVRPGAASGVLPTDARLRLEVETLATEPGVTNPRQLLPAMPLPRDRSKFVVTLAADFPRPRGMFKLHGTLIDAADRPLGAPVATTFARLPRPSETPAEDSFFGIHATLRPAAIATARALGNRWLRLHDASWATKWAAVQPEEGEFRFADDGIDAARAEGFAILGMLCGAPPWASAKPRATTGYWAGYNYPDRADGANLWSRYVARTVGHYAGRIDHWEVWNEPWSNGFFRGTPAQYGELLGLAARTARETNPAARILGFNTAAHKGDWTREALAATPPEAFDIFSFHDYNASFYGGEDSNAVRLARRFTDIQEAWGEPRPLWDTEGGPGHVASWHALPGASGKGLSPRAQLAHIVRFDVTQMSAGVRRSFYYTLHHPPPSGESAYQALEHDGGIRPVMAARAVLASLVDGARWLERIEPAPGLEAHVFERRNGSRVSVIWSTDGGDPVWYAPPPGGEMFDVLGNRVATLPVPVSSTPVYLITEPRP